MQVHVRSLLSSTDDSFVLINTNNQATVQSLISGYCVQKGIPFNAKLTIFDGSRRPLPHHSTLQTLGIRDGDMLSVGYKEKSKKLRAQWPIVMAIIALLIGFIGILTISLVYGLTGGKIPFDYGVVLDAGSSKTQVYLYKWCGDKDRGTGRAFQNGTWKVNGGIAEKDPDYVLPYVKQAVDMLPPKNVPTTPLYLAATAGMRLINLTNPDKASEIMDSLYATLNTTGLDVIEVKMISGRDEGFYAWISANYMKETLQIEQKVKPWQHTTIGALDMGGASTQVSFAVEPGTVNENSTDLVTVELFGHTHNVYSKSFLCYGRGEATKRYHALLVQDIKNNVIKSPCEPKGWEGNFTGNELFNQPCTENPEFLRLLKENPPLKNKTFTFVGSNDIDSCRSKISDLLNTATCRAKEFKECFEKLEVSIADEQFLAFATYFFTTDFLKITKANITEYATIATEYCLKTYEELKNTTDEKVHKFLHTYCFNAWFIYDILTTGYGFNETTWKNIDFVGMIDEKDVGWSLGYMINATNAIPAKKPSPKPFAVGALVGALLVFILLIAVAIVVIFKASHHRSSMDLP